MPRRRRSRETLDAVSPLEDVGVAAIRKGRKPGGKRPPPALPIRREPHQVTPFQGRRVGSIEIDTTIARPS